ncbi:hypothetical protein HYG87_02295 [Methanobacterium alkalithermotolerans]|uniref:PLD phosphodiesterase domain-containing protein n=1 Tax=Methanobacterium alkalithermotolerans TaxID=2731220 RepID=A0A8T8K6D8_9EURY|nr:phospholipase D family protein [Methanobacterium alkalithermotolerans]QUH22683.1 hypothetical protein HYG87_02295 [Methanobacterium alkalithermotolerans]
MSIIIFKGRLKRIKGFNLPSYQVIIYNPDKAGLLDQGKLGESRTHKKGEFQVKTDLSSDDALFTNHHFKIKMEVLLEGDLIYETQIAGEFTGKVINLGEIKLQGNHHGVTGKLVDEEGQPLKDLVVVARKVNRKENSILEKDPLKLVDKVLPRLKGEKILGKSRTSKEGYYEIYYPPSSYHTLLGEKEDIEVAVRDSLDVSDLYIGEKIQDPSCAIIKADDIQLNRQDAVGWLVTLGRSKKSRYTTKNKVEFLIDNEVALESMLREINQARNFIYLTQFEFDPELLATYSDEYPPREFLVKALSRASKRGVEVKIVLNENLLIPDNFIQIRDYFQKSGVEVREFTSKGLYVMHAKTLLIDGKTGFIIGSPFKQLYWDTTSHLIADPRREGGPVHDVSLQLEGESLTYLEEFFLQLWNHITQKEYQGQGMLKSRFSPVSTGDIPLQIARSITPDSLSKKGERGIFEAYRKAIARAQDFIYLENQYFTNKTMIKALKNALKANENLQVVVVLNENPDIPGYKQWQNGSLEKLGIKSASDNLEHPQIGFFTLGAGDNQKIQPIYVHSKVGIVDDRWATVGTANLDGSSLTYVNELEGLVDTTFHRNMELNAIIPDRDKKTGEVLKLRKALWSEHLGIEKDLLKKEDNGWLGLWQKRAKENIRSISKKKPHFKGQLLPYSFELTAQSQLKDMGVKLNDEDVLE